MGGRRDPAPVVVQQRQVYLYVRISDQDQSIYSLDAQERDCGRLAEANGWRVARVFIEKMSGAKEGRPRLRELREALQPGDVVIVWKLDRLGRNPVEVRNVIDDWADRDIRLMSVSDSWLDVADHTGREMATIHAAIGGIERNKIRERVRRGMHEKAEQGFWPGATPPYGYTIRDGLLVINESQAWVIRQVYEWYLVDGLGTDAIAEKLNGKILPSPKGVLWEGSVIRNMLDNEVYAGTLVWGEFGTGSRYKTKRATPELTVRKEAAFEPIIDMATWKATRTRREARAELAPRSLAPSPYYLTGRLRCGVCGNAMGGETRHGRVYYRCCGRRTNRNLNCHMPMVRGERLHDEWLGLLTQMLDPVQVQAALAAELNQSDKSEAQRDRIHERLTELDQAETSWDRKAEKGLVSDEEWSAKTRPIKVERDALKVELQTLGAPRPVISPEAISATAAAIIRAWENADDAQRKELVRQSCSKLILTADHELKIAVN